MKRHINTNAFQNIIQNTELHNRMKEEQKMWVQKRKNDSSTVSEGSSRKRKPSFYDSSDDEYSRHKKKKKKKRKSRTANIIDDDAKVCLPQPNQERWGHSGFLELYSNEVISGACFTDKHARSDSYCTDSDKSFTDHKKKKKKLKKKKRHKSKHKK